MFLLIYNRRLLSFTGLIIAKNVMTHINQMCSSKKNLFLIFQTFTVPCCKLLTLTNQPFIIPIKSNQYQSNPHHRCRRIVLTDLVLQSFDPSLQVSRGVEVFALVSAAAAFNVVHANNDTVLPAVHHAGL